MNSYIQSAILHSPNQLISYSDYISMALYDPMFGYYMKEKQKIGRLGDFITTSNISDIYGKQIAKWASWVFKQTNLLPFFYEIGAGNGRFASAFLQEWHKQVNRPLNYVIVETSPFHRVLQRELLSDFPNITQVNSLTELSAVEGIIFSNELFDALPVHVIEKNNGKLFEVMIGLNGHELVEKKVPLQNSNILAFLEETAITLEENQRMEIPIIMGKMILEISDVLKRGLVVTADYGYTNEEWKDPQRRKGSLRGYYQHQMIDDVLKYPGDIDITTHIHWDYLTQKGSQAGLNTIAKLRQDEFLLKAGILQELEAHFDSNPFSEVSKRNRAIRSLIMPGGISTYFHVLIQQKKLMLSDSDLFAE